MYKTTLITKTYTQERAYNPTERWLLKIAVLDSKDGCDCVLYGALCLVVAGITLSQSMAHSHRNRVGPSVCLQLDEEKAIKDRSHSWSVDQ